MLPEAAGRKCTNTHKMIRSFVVDRLRCGHPGLSCSREEKMWMPRPNALKAAFRPRFHRPIAVFRGRGKKDGPILAE
jgi:hypothetical protein